MNIKHLRLLIMCLLSLASFCAKAQHLDQVLFGDTTSEKNHGITSYALLKTEVYTGSKGQKARRFLPNNSNPFQGPYAGIYGGEVFFDMKVDSTRQNYVTVKFSGDEITGGRILLNVEGKELGGRHGGDEELFFESSETSPGAFFYRTAPIPRTLTNNKTHVTIRMRSSGPFYAYGTPGNFPTYQKPMVSKTCGIYRAYMHTNPAFSIPTDDIQGTTPNYSTAAANTSTSLANIKASIIQKAKDKVTALLNGSDDIRVNAYNYNDDITLLAQAYEMPYNTVAYHNPSVIAKIKKAVDRIVVNSNLPGGLKANGAWGGAFGRPAFAVSLIYNQLTGLDSIADLGGGPNLTRRQQWIKVFKESLDAGAVDRRSISNQILDASISFYGAALGLAKLDPVNYSEFPKAAIHYVLEAAGIEQFTGTMTNLNTKNPILGNPATSNKGAAYFFITPKGGSHEPGWVSIDCYGDLAHSLFDIWTMTKSDPNVTAYGIQQGDKRVLDKAVAHNKLQTGFTYPWMEDGKKAILAEGGICWRNIYIPGKMHYGSPVIAGLTNDPDGIGYTKQMAADGQLDHIVNESVNILAYHYLPEAIDHIIASGSTKKIPSTPNETSNVVSDEENGVVAIHRGDEHIFITLYNRATSDNRSAKAHHLSSIVERKIEFRPDKTDYFSSGSYKIRTDNVTGNYSGDAPDKPVSGYTGQKEFYPSYDRTSKYSGERCIAEFYQARYGKYYIAMNTTRDLTKTIEFPADLVGKSAEEISTHSSTVLSATATIPPSTTLVYYIANTTENPGLITDTRPTPSGVTKTTLSTKIIEVESFVTRDTVINKVTTSPLDKYYKHNRFADVIQQLSFAKYTLEDLRATQAEADTAHNRLGRAYVALIGDKYSYATNTLANGTYYIKIRNTNLFLTKNSTATPLFDTVNVNLSLQRWKIVKDGARYKITSENNGAYLNENAKFSTNAYTSNWNTMNIYTSAGAQAIQKGGTAGNQYWTISGNQILGTGTAVTVPASFPFELVLYIYADLDAKIAEARALHAAAKPSTFTGELGTYPPSAISTFLTAIENAEANRNTLTTIAQVTTETATLNTALENFKKTFVFQRNQLANGKYYLKFNSTYYTTPVGFNAKDSVDLVSQQWQITYNNNVGYHIMSVKSQTYWNENGNATKQATQLASDGDWVRFNIYFDGTKYAIQKRAPGQSTRYFTGVVSGTILSSVVSTYTDPSLFIFDLVPVVSPQNITFADLPAAKSNDPDMTLGASASSGLPVTYASSDTTVAKILSGKIKLLKAGTTTITAAQSGNTFFKPATSVSKTLTIKSPQTITFTALPVKTVIDTAFNPGAVSSAGLTVNYASSDTTVAKILNGRIQPISAGVSTITATQPGDSLRLAAAQVQQTLKVKAVQTITFAALSAKKIGDTDFDAGATASSGLSISYTSSNSAVATIVDGKIHIVGSGNSTITAAQLGDSTYVAAPSISRTLVVKTAQTITFATLSAKQIGDADFDASATASSGLAVNYTSSNTAVATIVDGKIHIVGSGSSTITAAQPGDSTYVAAPTISKTLVVKAVQTITFAALPAKKIGDADFDAGATASSGLAVNYTSSNTAVATIVDGKIHIVSSGNSTITAAQLGDSTYLAAPEISRTLQVKEDQLITFNTFSGKSVGDSDFALAATTNSGLPISYTSSNPAVATVNGNIVQVLTAGSAIITASQAGDNNYSEASKSQTLTVNQPNLAVNYVTSDYNLANDNNIKPDIQLVNNGSNAVAYNELTIRYWFSAENYAGINTWIDYAQIGSSKIRLNHIQTTQPMAGTNGYIEYSFDPSAGNLNPGSSTGPIRIRIANKDWSTLEEGDDHSYVNTQSYLPNNKITVYRNGKLIFGNEPVAVTPLVKLSVVSENKNSSTGTNTISTYLKIKNEGNVPLNYSGISVRYWFTHEGTSPLNLLVDYAKVGNSNILGQFVKPAQLLTNADTYLELKVNPSVGKLYPSSTTGEIKYRITKNDWSNFNELNDHSYLAAAPYAENMKITAYYEGQLIYGTEPVALSPNNTQSTASSKQASVTEQPKEQPIQFMAYPNPFTESINLKYTLKTDAIVTIKVSNAVSGSLVYKSAALNLKAGEHTTPVAFKGEPGNYIITLEYGGKLKSALIFKQ